MYFKTDDIKCDIWSEKSHTVITNHSNHSCSSDTSIDICNSLVFVHFLKPSLNSFFILKWVLIVAEFKLVKVLQKALHKMNTSKWTQSVDVCMYVCVCVCVYEWMRMKEGGCVGTIDQAKCTRTHLECEIKVN